MQLQLRSSCGSSCSSGCWLLGAPILMVNAVKRSTEILQPRVAYSVFPTPTPPPTFLLHSRVGVAAALSFMQACGKFQRSAVILITKNISSLCTQCSCCCSMLFLPFFSLFCSALASIYLFLYFFSCFFCVILPPLLLHFMTFAVVVSQRKTFPIYQRAFCFSCIPPLAWISPVCV